jgi:HEAT repeat protein
MPALALLLCLAAGCGGSAPDYRVTTDLGPAIHALGGDDLEQSDPAADRIAALGPEAIPALATALAREPPAVRLGVVDVLGRIEAPGALALLAGVAAHDRDVEVRAMAIRTLGGHPGEEERVVVETALSDPEARIRLEAAGACAALCTTPSALARLVTLALRDQPLANGVAAHAALVRMLAGPDHALSEQARAAIRAQVPVALGGDGETALRAALLASDVGDPSGREVLARAVRGDAPAVLRLQAVHALGTVGTDAEVPLLAALDGQPGFGEYAYDALRRLAGRGVGGAQPAVDGWRGPAPPGALPLPGAG